MLEKLVSELLTSYLGEYFENVDMEQVKISLWRGEVHLQQLRVRKDALRFFDVPFCIADGVIEELVVTIPWTHLNSESVVLAMRHVRLVVQQRRTAGYTAAQVYKENMERKTRQLEAFDEILLEEWANTLRAASNEAVNATTSGDNTTKDNGETKKDSTFVARLRAAVVHNIKLTMEDVRLEYVCSVASPTPTSQAPSQEVTENAASEQETDTSAQHNTSQSHGGQQQQLGLSLHIHYLSTYACDEAYEPAFAAVKSRLMHKQLRLNGVSIRLLTGTTNNGAYEIVRPFNALALLQHQPVLFHPRVPRNLLGVRLEDFTVQLDEHQWGCLLHIAHDVWQARALDFDVRKRPRHAGPRQDPRAWWHYACHVVLQRLRRRPGRGSGITFSWSLYREVKQLRMEYTRLYMRARRAVLQATRWLDALSPEEAQRLYTLEEELPVEVIQMARRMALQRVQQERAEYLRIMQERRQKQQQQSTALSPRSTTPGVTTSSSLEESSSNDTAASPHAAPAVPPPATASNWLLRWWERRGATNNTTSKNGESDATAGPAAEERSEIQHMIDLMTAPRWTEAERIAMAQEFGCTTEEANELLGSSGTSAASSPAAAAAANNNATPRQSSGGADGQRVVVHLRLIIELAHVAAQLHNRTIASNQSLHATAGSQAGIGEGAAALVGVYMHGVTLGVEQMDSGTLEAWAAIAVYGADTCSAAGRRCASILHAYRESDGAGDIGDEVARRVRSEEYAALQGREEQTTTTATVIGSESVHRATTPSRGGTTPIQPALSPLQSGSVERSPSVAVDHAGTISKQIKNALVHRMRIPFATCATIVRTTAAVFATYSAQLGCAGQGGTSSGSREPQRIALFCAALDVQVDAQLTRHLTSFVLLPLTRLARNMRDDDPLLRPLVKSDAVADVKTTSLAPSADSTTGTTLIEAAAQGIYDTITKDIMTTPGSALEPFALWSIPANEQREVQDAQLRLRSLLHHVEHAWSIDWRCELETLTLYIANPAHTHATRLQLRTVHVQNDMEQQRRRARRAATPLNNKTNTMAAAQDERSDESPRRDSDVVAFQPAAFGEEEDDWVSTVTVTIGETALACALTSAPPSKTTEVDDTTVHEANAAQPITSSSSDVVVGGGRPWQKEAWRAVVERLPLRLTLKLNLLGRRHPTYPSIALQLQSQRLLMLSVSRTRLAILQHSVSLVSNLAQEVDREWKACYAVLRPEQNDTLASLGWFELAVLQQDTAFLDDDDNIDDEAQNVAFASWPHCMVEVRPGCVVVYHADRSAYPRYYLELRRDHFHLRLHDKYIDLYVENGGPVQINGTRRHYRDALRLVRTTTQLPMALADNATLLRAYVEGWLQHAPPHRVSEELQRQLTEALVVLESGASAVPCYHLRFAARDASELARLEKILRRSGAMSTQAVLALDEATLRARAEAVPQLVREQKLVSATVTIPALQLKLVEEEEEGKSRVDVHEFACTPFHLVYDQHRDRHVIALETNECALHAFPERGKKAAVAQEREAMSARSQKAVVRVSPVTVVSRNTKAPSTSDTTISSTPNKDAMALSLRVTITPRPRPLALLSDIQLSVQPSALLQLRLNMALARAVEALWDCFGTLIGRQYFPLVATCNPWRTSEEKEEGSAAVSERRWREDTSGGAMLQNVATLHVDRVYVELFCPLADKTITRQDDIQSSPTMVTSASHNEDDSSRSVAASKIDTSRTTSVTEPTTFTTTVVEPTPALTLAGRRLALDWHDWVGRSTVQLSLQQPKIDLQAFTTTTPAAVSDAAEDTLVTFVAPMSSKEGTQGGSSAEVSLELERPPPMLSLSDYLQSAAASTSATGFRVAQRLRVEATHVQMLYRHREFMSLLGLLTCDMLKRLLALTQRPPFQLLTQQHDNSDDKTMGNDNGSEVNVAATPLMPSSPATLRSEESSATPNTVVSWGWMEKRIVVREARVWLPETDGVPTNEEEEQEIVTTASRTLRERTNEASSRPEQSSLVPPLTARVDELVVQDVLQPRFGPTRLSSDGDKDKVVVQEVQLETTVHVSGADVRHASNTASSSARDQVQPVFMRELGLRLGIAQVLFASPLTVPLGKTFRIALDDVIVHGSSTTLELLLNMFYKNYLEPIAGNASELPGTTLSGEAPMQSAEDSRWYIDVPYTCLHLQCPAVTLRQDAMQAIVRSRIDSAVVVQALHVELNWQRGRLAAITLALGCVSAWELGHMATTQPWTRHPSEVALAGAAFVQLFSPTHDCLRDTTTRSDDDVVHEGVSDPALLVRLAWGEATSEVSSAVATRQTEVQLHGVVFTVLPRALFDLRDAFMGLGVYNAVARMLRWPLYDREAGMPIVDTVPRDVSAAVSTRYQLRIERLSVNLPGMKSNVLVPLACIAVEGVAARLEQGVQGQRTVQLSVRALSRNGIFSTTNGTAKPSGLVEAEALPLRPLLLQPTSTTSSPTTTATASQSAQKEEDLLEELFADPTTTSTTQPPTTTASSDNVEVTPWLRLEYRTGNATTTTTSSADGLYGVVSPVWFITPQADHLTRLQRAWAQGGYRHLRWLPSFAEARHRVAQGGATQSGHELAANLSAAPRGWQVIPIELTLHTPCIVIHEEDTSAKEARHLVKGLLLEMGDVTMRNVVVNNDDDKGEVKAKETTKADNSSSSIAAVYSAVTLPAMTLREVAHRDRVILQPVALELRREWQSETQAWRSSGTVGSLRLWLTLSQYATLLNSLFNTSFFYHLGRIGADDAAEESVNDSSTAAAQSTTIATLHYLFGADGVGLGMEAVTDVIAADALREAGDTMARQQTQLRLAGLDVRVRGETTRVRFGMGAVELNTMTTTTTAEGEAATPEASASKAVNRIRLTVAGDVVLGVEESRALIALRSEQHGDSHTEAANKVTTSPSLTPAEDLCVDLSLTRQEGIEEGLAQLGTLSLYLEPHATAAVLALLYLPYAKAIHTAHGDDKVLSLVQNTTLSESLHLSSHNQLHAKATQYNCLTLDAAGHEVHLRGSDSGNEDDAPIILDEGLTLYITHARLFLHGRPLETYVKAGPGSYVVAEATMNEVIFTDPGKAASCDVARPGRSSLVPYGEETTQVMRRGNVTVAAATRVSDTQKPPPPSPQVRPRLHRLFNVSGRLRVVLPQMALPSTSTNTTTTTSSNVNDRGRSLVLDAMATVQLVERDETKGANTSTDATRDHLRAVSIDLDEFRVRNDYSLGEGVVVESSDLVSQLAIKALYTVITHGDGAVRNDDEEDDDDGRAAAEKELEVNVLTDVSVQLRYSDAYLCVAAVQQARAALMHAVGTLEMNAFTRLFSRYSQRVMSLETATSESSTDVDCAPSAAPHYTHSVAKSTTGPVAMSSMTATVTIGRVDVYLLNDSAQVDLPLFHLQLQKFRTHYEKQGSGPSDRCSATLYVSSSLNHYDLFNSSWLGLMDETALQVNFERTTRAPGGRASTAPPAVRDRPSDTESVLFYGVDVELPQVKFYVSPMLVRNVAALRTLRQRFMAEEAWLPATRTDTTPRAPWEQAVFQANLILQHAGLELHISFAQDDASRFPAPRTLRYGDSFAFNFPRIHGRELSAGQRSVLVALQDQVVAVNLAACGKARVPLGPSDLLRRHVLIDITVCEGQRRAELRSNVSVVNQLRVPIALDTQGSLVAPNETCRIRLEHLRRRVVLAPQSVSSATESCALGVCYAELPELSGQTFLCVSRTPAAATPQAQGARMYFFCTITTQAVAPTDFHGAMERGSFALNTSVADTTATLVAPLTLSNQLGLPVNVVLAGPRQGTASRGNAYERLAEFNINAGERYGITQADPLQPIYVELSLSQPNGGVLESASTGGLACIYNPREPARRQADIVLEDATTRARLVLCFQYRQKSEVVLWCPFWIVSKVPYRLQIAEDTGLQRSAANRTSRAGGGVTLIAGMNATDNNSGDETLTAIEPTQGKPFLFHTHTAQEKGWRYNLYIRMQLGARERGAGRWSRWAGPIPLLEITGQPRAVQCAFGQDSLLGMLSFTVEVARGQAGGGAIRVLTFYPHCTIVNRTRHPMQVCQTLRGGVGQSWVNDVDYVVPVAAERSEAIALGRGDENAASVAPPPSSSSSSSAGDTEGGGGALMPHFIRLRREPDATLEQSGDKARRTHWSRPISTTERGDQYVNLQYVQLIKMEDYWPSQATLDVEGQEGDNPSTSSNNSSSSGGGLAPQLPPLTPEMIVEQDRQLYVKVIRSAVCHVTCYWHNHVRCVEVTEPAWPPYMIENRTDCTLYVTQRMPGTANTNSFVAVHARTTKGYAFETTTVPPCLILIAKHSERGQSRPCELDLSATALAEQPEAMQRTIVFADTTSGKLQRVLYVRLRSGPGWSRVVSVTAEPTPHALPGPQAVINTRGTVATSARAATAVVRPRRRAAAVEWQVGMRVRGVYTLLTEGVGADYVLCTVKDLELVFAQSATREASHGGVAASQAAPPKRRYLQRFVCSMQSVQLDDERIGTKKVVVLKLQSRSFYTRWTRQLLRHAPVLYFRDVVIALGAIEAHLEDSFLYDMVHFYRVLLTPWRQTENATSTSAVVQNAAVLAPSAALASATDGTSWTLREVVIQDLQLERVALTLSLYHSPGEQYDLMWQKLSSLSFLIRSAKEVPLVWPRIRAREVCMPVWKLWDSYLEQYYHQLYSQVFSAVYSVAGDAVLGFFSNILAITGLTEGSGTSAEQARAALQHERRREAHFKRDAQEMDMLPQQQGGAMVTTSHTRTQTGTSSHNNNNNSSGTSVSNSAVAVSIIGTSERQSSRGNLSAASQASSTRPGSYASSAMTVSGPPRMFAVNNRQMSLQQMAATVSWGNFLSVVTASELRQYGAVAVRGALRASRAMPLISPRTAPPTITAALLIESSARSSAGNTIASRCTRCEAMEAMRVARLQQNAPTALPHPEQHSSASTTTPSITWAELAHHVSWQEFVELATNEEVARYAALVVDSLIGQPRNVILWQP